MKLKDGIGNSQDFVQGIPRLTFHDVGSYGTRIMVILIGRKLTSFDDDDIDDGSYDPPELKTLLELRYVRHYADSAIPDSLTSTVALPLI